MVEGERGELGRDLGAAGHHGHVVLGKEIARQLPDLLRRRGRQLARLDHGAVSRGERADQGRERQEELVVPGADDPDDAQRLVDEARPRGQELPARQHATGLHPATEVAPRVADGVHEREDLERQRLLARAPAEVLRDRADELLAAPQHPLLQAAQRAQPRAVSGSALGRCRPPLQIQNLSHVTRAFGDERAAAGATGRSRRPRS